MRRVVVASLALLLAASRAEAQSPPLLVRIDDCVEAAGAEIRQIVAIEIETSLMDADAPASPDTTLVDVGCDGNVVVLRANDPLTGKNLSRSIDLAATPAVTHARMIGLAVVELVVASWSELETGPEPVAPIIERRGTPVAREAARAHVRKRWSPPRTTSSHPRVSLIGRLTRGGAAVGGGIGAAFEVDRAQGFGWGVELMTQHATADRSRGAVAVDSVGGAGWAHLHIATGRLHARAGAGLRFEVVRVVGDAADGAAIDASSFAAVSGGPFGNGAVSIDVTQHTSIQLGAEAGYRALAVRALVSEERDVELDGPWLSAHLAMGWRW
jgi:hypothetical protein